MIITIILAVMVSAGMAWIYVPALYPVPISGLNEAVDAAREATRSQAIVTTRASVLAALAGVGALVTIAINYQNSIIANRNAEVAFSTLALTNRSFEVAARGHLTDRYAKAIEHLGDNDSLAIRLGGVYALRQFAVETDRIEDQATVVEVLSAFVRVNLPRRANVSDLGTDLSATTNRDKRRSCSVAGEPPADVLAAISTLAHLPDIAGLLRADFSGVDFRRIDLSRTRFSAANLRDTDLSGAFLGGADLEGADLSNAVLTRADFEFSRLTNVNLRGARLPEARMRYAELGSAVLRAADLDGVDLRDSNLYNADLREANLRGANLRDAHLSGADLRGADLRDACVQDANFVRAKLSGAFIGASGLSVEQREKILIDKD